MDTGPASDPSAARGQSSAVIRRQARPTGGAPGKGRETWPAGRAAGKGSAIADANGKGKGKRKGKGKGVARSSRSSRAGGGEGDGEGDSYGTLGKLVSKATTPGRETGYKYLDEDAVRRIKAIARTGDECAAGALRYLMQRMAAKSAEVRFMALAIVGQLFQRSRVVRAVLVADLKNFINLAVGHDPRQPLPGPPAAATALREKALALMEEWNEAHGQLYKGLRAAYRFLREAKRMKFPELQAQAARQREAAARKSKHAQRLLRAKYMQAKGEIAEQLPEIEGLLREMEECFGILVPVVPGTDAISHAETTDGPGGVAPDAPDALSSSRATSSSRDGTLAGGGGGYEGGDGGGGGGGGDGGRGGGGGNRAITRAEQAEGRGGERDSQARGGGAAEAAAETAMGAAVTQVASTNTGAAKDDGDDFDDGDGDGDDDDDDEGMEWEDGGGGGGGDSEEEKEEEEEGEEEEEEGGGGKRRRSRGAGAGAGAPRTIADTVEAAGLGSRGYELQVEVPVGWSWTIGADGSDAGGGGGGSGGDGGGDDVALVVTALRERYKVLTSRLLPLLSDWIQTLSRVQFDPEENRRPSDNSSSSSSSSSSRKEPHDRGATTTPTTTTTTVTPDPLTTPTSSVERRTCAGLLSRCLATRNAANALASKFVELKIDDGKEIGGGGGGERGSSTGRGHRGRGHENGSTAAAAAAPGVGKGKGGAGGAGGGGREGGGWEWGSTTAWRAPVSKKPRLQIRLQS